MKKVKKKEPITKISRTKVELYLDCPRCFYLDQVYGITRPSTGIFTLNTAVDRLLKTEFDSYRSAKKSHPIQVQNGLDLIPFEHPDLKTWRTNKKGIDTIYRGMTFYGIPDDVWMDKRGHLYLVDYKATANSTGAIKALGTSVFHQKYKRQLAFYQWLVRKNGFSVSETAYLVYATGNSARPSFDGVLSFDQVLIPVQGETDWIEPALNGLLDCLTMKKVPASDAECGYCAFVQQQSDL
ncbi:MAG: PD-(D/E)XK nuclease family protein [Bacteroidetes bacterium]|nr:PD-(D/E)XK nuclease family protein [Bacteroidota bacterium]